MRRSSVLAAVTVVAFVALPTAAAATTAPGLTYDIPPEPDVLVVSLPGYQIAGDGTVFRAEDFDSVTQGFAAAPAGNAAAIVPMPPPPLTFATIDAEGMQALYATADAHGLLDGDLAPPDDYDWCCDRPAITVTITLGDVTFRHFYPVGDDGKGFDPELLALRDFLDLEFDELVGADHVGEFVPYVPERWVIDDRVPWDVEPRPWPLAVEPEPGDCVELPTDAVTDTGSGVYSLGGDVVWASPLLPWQDCPSA